MISFCSNVPPILFSLHTITKNTAIYCSNLANPTTYSKQFANGQRSIKMSLFTDLEHLTMETTRSFETPKNHLPGNAASRPKRTKSYNWVQTYDEHNYVLITIN
jgi:hypothetical protein